MATSYTTTTRYYERLITTLFPDKSPWTIHGKLGEHLYVCFGCVSIFTFKEQFLIHINRKITRVEYKCHVCSPPKKLTFDNRCTWFLHVRDHLKKIRNPKVDISDLKFSSMPLNELGVNHEHTLFIDEEIPIAKNNKDFIDPFVYRAMPNEEASSVVNLQRVGIWMAQRTQAIKVICKNVPKCEIITAHKFSELINSIKFDEENVNTDADDVVKDEMTIEDVTLHDPSINNSPGSSSSAEMMTMLFKCKECNNVLTTPLAGHFWGNHIPSKWQCSLCHLNLPTKCSYAAHKRIHYELPPHICPDCGIEYPNHNSLGEHMTNDCYHTFKVVRYCCPGPKCWKMFATSANFVKHMINHANLQWLCNVCNLILPDMDEVRLHKINTTHDEALKFYGCLVCPDNDRCHTLNMSEHVQTHLEERNSIYVFMCKVCKKLFKTAFKFRLHLKGKCGNALKHKSPISRSLIKPYHLNINSAERKQAAVETATSRPSSNHLQLSVPQDRAIVDNIVTTPNDKQMSVEEDSTLIADADAPVRQAAIDEPCQSNPVANANEEKADGTHNVGKQNEDIIEKANGEPLPASSIPSATENGITTDFLMCNFCNQFILTEEAEAHQEQCKTDFNSNHITPLDKETIMDIIGIPVKKEVVPAPETKEEVISSPEKGNDKPSEKSPHKAEDSSNRNVEVSKKGKMNGKTIRKRGRKSSSNEDDEQVDIKEEMDNTSFERSSSDANSPAKDTKQASRNKRKRISPKLKLRKVSRALFGGKRVLSMNTHKFDGTYRCITCQFECQDRGEFQLHVKNHKTTMSYHCMECGEGFLVKTTFFMHLKAVHGIWDTESYMKTNEFCQKSVEKIEQSNNNDGTKTTGDDEQYVEESTTNNKLCQGSNDPPNKDNIPKDDNTKKEDATQP